MLFNSFSRTMFYFHRCCLSQLKEADLATRSTKDELAEMTRRYQEKVGQWENSQEALDQLTDELQANQNLLQESRERADHLKGQLGTLREQVDTLKQRVSINKPAVADVDNL